MLKYEWTPIQVWLTNMSSKIWKKFAWWASHQNFKIKIYPGHQKKIDPYLGMTN